MAFDGQLSGLRLVGIVGFQEAVELGEEGLALDAVDHAGFLYGLTPGSATSRISPIMVSFSIFTAMIGVLLSFICAPIITGHLEKNKGGGKIL